MPVDMRKPRVLMIIAKFHPAIGGTENQALLLCENLVKKGCAVEVLTRHVPGLPKYAAVRGISVNRSIRVIDRGKLFGPTYFFSCLFFLLVQRKHYDIIHCHILHGFHSLAAVLVKFLCGKKVVIKVASSGVLSDFGMLRASLFGSLMLRFLHHADRIIALCGRAVDEALAHGFTERRIRVIPNGVDADRFRPATKPTCSIKRIVYAGSLTATKGVDVLIDAFYGLKREHMGLMLDIFGSGPLLDSLREKARALGLSRDVRFYGIVPDIERHLDGTCIFVQPSMVEGMSNVILEAMAAGLPIVATRAGAAPEIIQDGLSGLLVDAGSSEQIRDSVVRLLSDERLARHIGMEARSAIEAYYAIGIVADRYLELYQDLL